MDKKLNIGIVCYPTFGGSGVIATELGIGLAGQGHQIHFITYDRPARLTGMVHNVRYHEVKPTAYPLFDYSPYDSALVSKMVDTAKYEKLDLFHVHYAIPHATAGYLAHQILKADGIDVPVITTLHGTDITLVGNDPSFFNVVEFGINHSAGVTTVSKFLKQKTIETFDVKNHIEVIHNFVPPHICASTPAREEERKEFAPKGEKILVHISNFRPLKRVEDVLAVFEEVRRKIPAKLLLIGDGPDRDKLENYCRQKKLCKDISFLGKMADIGQILCISDLMLLTSVTESFGLVLLEAMACGTPVITTDVGGIPEVNIHGKTGFMAPVGDIKSMSKYALSLLENKPLLEVFKKQALEQANAFTLDKILPQYEAFYHSILLKKQQHFGELSTR